MKEEARERLARAEAAAEDPANPEAARDLKIARNREQQSRYYTEARRLGAIISQANLDSTDFNWVVATGGGPGIMGGQPRRP